MSKLYGQILISNEDNLNKENFWNKCMEFYPKTTKDFCEFIDSYKQKVHWELLFQNYFNNKVGVKFHDIPFEMQLGIIIRYIFGSSYITVPNIPLVKSKSIEYICEFFEHQELNS